MGRVQKSQAPSKSENIPSNKKGPKNHRKVSRSLTGSIIDFLGNNHISVKEEERKKKMKQASLAGRNPTASWPTYHPTIFAPLFSNANLFKSILSIFHSEITTFSVERAHAKIKRADSFVERGKEKKIGSLIQGPRSWEKNKKGPADESKQRQLYTPSRIL